MTDKLQVGDYVQYINPTYPRRHGQFGKITKIMPSGRKAYLAMDSGEESYLNTIFMKKVEKPMSEPIKAEKVEFKIGDYVQYITPNEYNSRQMTVGRIIEIDLAGSYVIIKFLRDELIYQIPPKYLRPYEGETMPENFEWEEGDIVRFFKEDSAYHNKVGTVLEVMSNTLIIRSEDTQRHQLSKRYFKLIHRPKTITHFEPQYSRTWNENTILTVHGDNYITMKQTVEPKPHIPFRPGDLLGYIGDVECYKGMTCRVISQVPETNSVQVQWLVPNSRRAPKSVLPDSVFNLLQSAPKKQPREIKERDFGSFGFRGNSLTEFMDGRE